MRVISLVKWCYKGNMGKATFDQKKAVYSFISSWDPDFACLVHEVRHQIKGIAMLSNEHTEVK